MPVNYLITGCGLTINEDFRVWGDLFEVGDCYVFNACGPGEGLAKPLRPEMKQLSVADSMYENYFERRNVFVIPKAEATLNQAALDYVNKGKCYEQVPCA